MTDSESDPLGTVEGDDARLEVEKTLLPDTDNSVRPEDGDQPEIETH